jgi:hypothetical protein
MFEIDGSEVSDILLATTATAVEIMPYDGNITERRFFNTLSPQKNTERERGRK